MFDRMCSRCRIPIPTDYPRGVTCGACDGEIVAAPHVTLQRQIDYVEAEMIAAGTEAQRYRYLAAELALTLLDLRRQFKELRKEG